MWAAIVNFFRMIFGGGKTVPQVMTDRTVPQVMTDRTERTAAAALQLRKDAKAAITNNEMGRISCPFHQEDAKSLRFNKTTNAFHCDGCARSGSMLTLNTRLDDPDAYRIAVS